MSFVKTIDAEVKKTSEVVLRKKLRQANVTGATIGDDDFVMKNGYLYTVVRAITARVNQNYDAWPSDELKLSYKTFVGKPIFVNHQNSDPTKARGRVIAARYFENGNDKGIECIMEVDAQRFPHLAHEIRTGGMDSVSMGAEAGHTICSMCGNKATDTHDMCDHVKFHKGEHLLKNGKKQLVYETCHKLGFFELSYVFDPADETAVVSKVIQANRTAGAEPGTDRNDEFGDEWRDMFWGESHDQDWRKVKPDYMDLMYDTVRKAAVNSGDPNYQYGYHFIPKADALTQYDPTQPVLVHRNIAPVRPGAWSIKQGPKQHVVGYADTAHMVGPNGEPVRVVIQEGGQAKAVERGQRGVHAFFKGMLGPPPEQMPESRGLTYDFKKNKTFVDLETGEPIGDSDLVHFQPNGWANYVPRKAAPVTGARLALHHLAMATTAAEAASMADAIRNEWGSVENWKQWAKARPRKHDVKGADDAELDARAEAFRNNDYNGMFLPVEAMIRQAYGEVEAPESIDTLDGSKDGEEGSEQDFHSYVDTPAELRDPNLDRTQQLDREQEQEGLDGDRLVEDVEGWEAPDHAQNEQAAMRSDQQYLASLRMADSTPYANGGGADFFHEPLDSPFQVKDPAAGLLPQAVGSEGHGGFTTPNHGSEGMREGLSNAAENPLTPPSLPGGPINMSIGDHVGDTNLTAPSASLPGSSAAGEAINGPSTTTIPTLQASTDAHYLAAMGVSPVKNGSSQMNQRRAREEDTMARRSSLASRGKTAARGRQGTQRTAEGPLTDGGDQSENSQGEQEEAFITQTPSPEGVDLGDVAGGISNTENNLVARINHTQQQLLRDAARLQALQQRRADAGLGNATGAGVDPMPQGSVPAPPPPPVAPGGQLGQSLVASRRNQIAHKIAWMQQRLGRRLTADESAAVATSVPETADTVNPSLSGTDDQSLKGQNFQPADPNAGVQTTQPKDASRQVFTAFDRWFTQGTGMRPFVAAARGNERYVLTAAKKFADHYRFNPDAYFPVMGQVLRQAKLQRRADTSLDLAAPGGRIDVEAPTSNTTDAEAQASQYDIRDFGGNASDNLADPDLSTDSVTWAPGEGKKEGGFKRASTAQAVRAADLFVEAGIRPKEDRYNLIATHETMRAGQVQDRIAMCEAFIARRQQDAQRYAAQSRRVAGVSRGAVPAALPPGFGSGQLRTAGNQRVSALEDQGTDSLLFM